MNVSEKWGDSVDAAVELALEELSLGIDDVDVEVLEEPSRGFFGIGSKLALVRVTKKESQSEDENFGLKPKKKVQKKVRNNTSSSKQDKSKRSKDKDDIVNKKVDNIEREVKENHIENKIDMEKFIPLDENDKALVFLKDLMKEMGLDIEVTGKKYENDIYCFLEGKDTGTVIGKRGSTLDAIQYLTSLVVNKGKEEYVRVVVDAENYRSKREKSLEKLAQRLADKVVRTRRNYKLEPMNPYERKVIHATLQRDDRILTRSEGQDPYRRVIIEVK